MFESVILNALLDIAPDPIERVAENGGLLAVIAAVVAVIIGSVTVLFKKKK